MGSIWPFQVGAPRNIEQAEAKTRIALADRREAAPPFLVLGRTSARADWLLKGDARETLAQLLTQRGHAVSESEFIAVSEDSLLERVTAAAEERPRPKPDSPPK